MLGRIDVDPSETHRSSSRYHRRANKRHQRAPRDRFSGKYASTVEMVAPIHINSQVFARGTSILGSNTFTRASEVNVPLQFQGDLWIHPGDIFAGDADGAVVIPSSLMDQVIALCQERAEIDERTFAALRAGEEMGPTIKKFRKS